jgi:hypothetical protein
LEAADMAILPFARSFMNIATRITLALRDGFPAVVVQPEV